MIKNKNFISKMLTKWKNLKLVEKILLSFFFVFFVFEAIVQFYPFVWVFNNSIKTPDEFNFATNKTLITTTWAFSNYLKVFTDFTYGDISYFQMLGNSLWQTALFLFVNLFASMLIGYALAKFRFPGRNLLYGILIFTQVVPIIGSGAASYKLRYELGMINNPYTIWFYWMNGFDYSAFIMFGTFLGISKSYSESAELDGANEFQIFGKVIFPQILPLVIALGVNNFVSRWNDYATSQISLNQYPSLAYGLYLFQTGSNYNDSGKVVYYASLLMTALPGILLYIMFQNLIIKNVSVGGIKG